MTDLERKMAKIHTNGHDAKVQRAVDAANDKRAGRS